MSIFDDNRYGGPQELFDGLGHPRDWCRDKQYLQRACFILPNDETAEFIPAFEVKRGWFWREVKKREVKK